MLKRHFPTFQINHTSCELHLSPVCPRNSVHLSKNMNTSIWCNVNIGVKRSAHQHRHAGYRRDSHVQPSIEQFGDLCLSHTEFHRNNILPEPCSKKSSKILWGPTQATAVPCPSAKASASVSCSTTNQQVEAGHR